MIDALMHDHVVLSFSIPFCALARWFYSEIPLFSLCHMEHFVEWLLQFKKYIISNREYNLLKSYWFAKHWGIFNKQSNKLNPVGREIKMWTWIYPVSRSFEFSFELAQKLQYLRNCCINNVCKLAAMFYSCSFVHL